MPWLPWFPWIGWAVIGMTFLVVCFLYACLWVARKTEDEA